MFISFILGSENMLLLAWRKYLPSGASSNLTWYNRDGKIKNMFADGLDILHLSLYLLLRTATQEIAVVPIHT